MSNEGFWHLVKLGKKRSFTSAKSFNRAWLRRETSSYQDTYSRAKCVVLQGMQYKAVAKALEKPIKRFPLPY